MVHSLETIRAMNEGHSSGPAWVSDTVFYYEPLGMSISVPRQALLDEAVLEASSQGVEAFIHALQEWSRDGVW